MAFRKWFIRTLSEYVPITAYQHEILETAEGVRFALDGPRWMRPRQREFLLRGWCFSLEEDIVSVRITTKQGTQVARYGIERHDLLEAFQTHSDRVLFSGFEVPLKVPRGSTRFTLEVQFHNGDWKPMVTEYLVRPRIASFDPANSIRGKHPYTQWVKAYDTLSEDDHEAIREHLKTFVDPPLISVVVPTYNTPVKQLDTMIESVRAQLYENWELCIADDHSPNRRTRKRLRYWAAKDPRIKVTFRQTNGHISACSNTAIDSVTGPYMALLDHDDELPAHALYFVAHELQRHPEAQIIYSDEDKITHDGYRLDPYFKPDFGRDIFCSHNVVSHLGVYRTDLIRKIGGFRENFVGSQDWDLVLRCLDHIQDSEIIHIPRILYHWRLSSQSTSSSVGNKGYAVTSGERALREFLSKYEPNGIVEDGPTIGSFRIRYTIPDNPLVSIIILTRNNAELLKQCVESLFEVTAYKHFELILVDNNTDDEDALAYLEELSQRDKIQVFKKPVPFNFSGLNNWAAGKASGEVLLFLNNDIEIVEPDWLREMVSHAIRPGIGPVGAKLLYPDDYIQHAGMVMGIGGLAGHAFKFLHRHNPGHIGRASIIQNYSAVTAACLAVRKSVFDELGGFDADNLGTAYNDADFCLRAWETGYRTLWTPHALLVHHESASRGLENSNEKKARWQKEANFMLNKWKPIVDRDPFYNPAFSLLTEDFSLAKPPRYERPWKDYLQGSEDA